MFSYVPLQEPSKSIRLLQITPGVDANRLHLRLCLHSSFSPTTIPVYAALSYAWGPPQPSQTISINGQAFQIRLNLWQLLLQLRRSGVLGPIWTDAICINQDDVAEKDAQVCMMGEIYSRAHEVIVWLGEEADQSSRVIDAANQHDSSFVRDKLSPFLSDLGLLPSLSALLDRPYWHRTWILQEISLAQGDVSVLCDNSKTTLRNLKSIFETHYDQLILDGEPVPGSWPSDEETPRNWTILTNCTLRKLLDRDPTSDTSLEELLNRHCDSLCFDPRDKVYAVQTMAHGRTVPVSYSVPVCELYWNVLVCCNSSDPHFGRTVQQSLAVSVESLRQFADLLATANTLGSITNLDVPFGTLPDISIRMVGTVHRVEHVEVKGSRNASKLTGQRFGINVTSSLNSDLVYDTGISSFQLIEDDVIFVLNHIPDLAMVSRTAYIIKPGSQAPTGPYHDTIDDGPPFVGIVFLNAPADQQQLADLLQVLPRINVNADRLRGSGVRRLYENPRVASGSSSLILNTTAILSLLEYDEFVEEKRAVDGRFRDQTRWEDMWQNFAST